MAALRLTGDRTPRPLVQSTFAEQEGRFSPDGRWIAYQSRESGELEVYVASVDAPGRKWRVSAKGGSMPRWSPDGREIFYLAPPDRMMAVTITAAAADLRIGTPTPLFAVRLAHPSWTLSPDGQRFLINTATEENTPAPPTLLVNWPAAVGRITH